MFGPGVGECILVHCGAGIWICFDCANKDGSPWPLTYLADLGLNPTDCIRLIIATHWHADHVRGISRVVETCRRAKFVCSSAVRSDEFEQLVARFSVEEIATPRAAPLTEVRRTFELLHSRLQNNDPDYIPPDLANAHQILDRFSAGTSMVTVTALSPSPQDRINALAAFANNFVDPELAASGLSPIDQNHASIVVVIEIGNDTLLFGADLETTKSPHTGWNAVVASGLRPQQPSQIFKIAHHGSSTSHSEDVWRRMLVSDASTVFTPYVPAGVPDHGEIEWLRARGTTVFATGLPELVNVRRRREVDKKRKEVTRSFHSYRLPEDPGIVRLRKDQNHMGSWEAQLFGAAVKIA